MKRYFFTGIFFILFSSMSIFAQSPWEQHGTIEVSENGRTLQYKDGTPFLWIGDTGWGMFQQLNREEVDYYLDHRQKLGFTVIQSVVYWYPHGGGIESGPHNAANSYGHRPFRGEADAPDTSQPLIIDGGSPEAPNDYWDHVDYIIAAVKKRNMHLALLPCWGRAYITSQMQDTHQEFDEKEARSYGSFLGSRYGEEGNILWVLGGDAMAKMKDYDRRSVFRAMAEGIFKGVIGQEASWNQKDPAWDQVFISYHPDGVPDMNSSSWFHEDAWLDANGVEVWKEVDLVYQTMLGDYLLKDPVKPSLFLEGSYEFGSYGHECGWVTPLRVRRQIYHTFFAGGAGHTYGAGPVWAMRGSGGAYNCGYTWKQALEFPGAANFAGVCKSFLEEYNWSTWMPEKGAIGRGAGDGDSLKVAVTDLSGRQVLVYYSNTTHAEIRNTMKMAAGAQWFDPRNGEFVQAGSFQAGEGRDMLPPYGWEDAILVLSAGE